MELNSFLICLTWNLSSLNTVLKSPTPSPLWYSFYLILNSNLKTFDAAKDKLSPKQLSPADLVKESSLIIQFLSTKVDSEVAICGMQKSLVAGLYEETGVYGEVIKKLHFSHLKIACWCYYGQLR